MVSKLLAPPPNPLELTLSVLSPFRPSDHQPSKETLPQAQLGAMVCGPLIAASSGPKGRDKDGGFCKGHLVTSNATVFQGSSTLLGWTRGYSLGRYAETG